MVSKQQLENITGNLRDAYLQCVPGTIQHVDQLINERKTNPQTCSHPLFIADGIVYSLNSIQKPILLITREKFNPVLKNINDAFYQLVNNGYYRVSWNDFRSLQADNETVRIDLTELTLQGNEPQCRYLNILGDKYDKLNSEDRRLAECVYGTGRNFIANMGELPHRGMTRSMIILLDPDYVVKQARYGPIALAAWANRYYGDFFFNDDSHHNPNKQICIRAVRNGSSIDSKILQGKNQ